MMVGRALVSLVLFMAFGTTLAHACVGNLFTRVEPDAANIASLLNFSSTQVQLNIPPRFMWGWGTNTTGYCGETSFQSAGLYFGSWISTQFFRYAAGNGNTQILIYNGSISDDYDNVAARFGFRVAHFVTSQYQTPQVNAYASWTRDHILQGHPVIGVTFVKEGQSEASDEYDHIVPFVGVTMNSSANSYAPQSPNTTNVSSVLINDLWMSTTRALSNPLAVQRAQWYDSSSSQPLDYALPEDFLYGVAVLGIRDDNGETYRMKLTAWSWTEPDWGDEDGCSETPQQITFSVAVYGLTAGQSFTIVRFDGNATVPSSNFGSAAYAKRWDLTANGTTFTMSPFDTIASNSVATYRAIATPANTTTAAPSETGVTTVSPSTTSAGDNATTGASTTTGAVTPTILSNSTTAVASSTSTVTSVSTTVEATTTTVASTVPSTTTTTLAPPPPPTTTAGVTSTATPPRSTTVNATTTSVPPSSSTTVAPSLAAAPSDDDDSNQALYAGIGVAAAVVLVAVAVIIWRHCSTRKASTATSSQSEEAEVALRPLNSNEARLQLQMLERVPMTRRGVEHDP